MNWWKKLKIAFTKVAFGEVPYGYWVLPTGQSIEVRDEAGHLNALLDNPPDQSIDWSATSMQDIYDSVFAKGWARFVPR